MFEAFCVKFEIQINNGDLSLNILLHVSDVGTMDCECLWTLLCLLVLLADRLKAPVTPALSILLIHHAADASKMLQDFWDGYIHWDEIFGLDNLKELSVLRALEQICIMAPTLNLRSGNRCVQYLSLSLKIFKFRVWTRSQSLEAGLFRSLIQIWIWVQIWMHSNICVADSQLNSDLSLNSNLNLHSIWVQIWGWDLKPPSTSLWSLSRLSLIPL